MLSASRRIAAAASAAVLLNAAPLPAQPRLTMDWEAMAEKIVERLAPAPGERILLVARPGQFDELIPPLRYALTRAGAVDLGVIDVLAEPHPAAWDGALLARNHDAARAAYRGMLRGVDGAIMLPGARPDHAVYAALQDLLHEGIGRTVHFHWTHNGSAFPLPGQPLPGQAVIDTVYQRALIETDYAGLAAVQRRFVEALRGAEARVTSPLGTDLRFRIGERPVHFGDGDASKARTDRGVILIDREIELPAGAVRVAPVEASVNGVIAFPASQWDGRPVSGLTVRIEAGRVAGLAAASGREAAEAELPPRRRRRAPSASSRSASPAARRARAQSVDPVLRLRRGIVRLSLGDNSELGGAVTAATSAGTSSPTRRSPSAAMSGCVTGSSCADPTPPYLGGGKRGDHDGHAPFGLRGGLAGSLWLLAGPAAANGGGPAGGALPGAAAQSTPAAGGAGAESDAAPFVGPPDRRGWPGRPRPPSRSWPRACTSPPVTGATAWRASPRKASSPPAS